MMSTREIVNAEESVTQNKDVEPKLENQKRVSGLSSTAIDEQIQRDFSNPEFRLRKPGKARARACNPVHPPFDTRQYVELVVTFNALKNFDLKEVPIPGQYVIRASCIGKHYGHFVSKSVDIHAIALFARGDGHQSHCPDINIDEELYFYIRFKELVDNPLLLSLCDTTGSPSTEYENLPPFAYICLDIAQILNFGSNSVETHVEPWVITDPKVQKQFLGGQPMLQLSIECLSGMPTPIQLRQGNTMTVFMESMSNLPEDILQNTSDPMDKAVMQVMITLPHSEKEPFLSFTGGRLTDGTFIEPPLTNLEHLDEATQTGDPGNYNEKDHLVRFAPTRHWASVRNHWADLPSKATAVSTALKPEMEDETAELFGDAVEAHAAAGSCGEPVISWDTQHHKYISMESYKKMLTRLSQDVIWPLEVIVTTQKPSTQKKSKVEVSRSEKIHKKKKKKQKGGDDSVETEPSEELTSAETMETEESEILYMNELGRPTTSEAVVIYHGIAFVDLTQLVYPGVQKVRFACRLQPFSQELLMTKTCLTKSAFHDTLQGVSRLSMYESSRTAGNLKENSELETSASPGFPESQESQKFPFIVFEISLKHAIIPLYKTLSDAHKTVQDHIPPREIPRRKLITAGVAQQNFRRAVLEAAAEVSAEYTNQYCKDVVKGRKEGLSADELKKGFIFYLNASGRYLVLREHLRQAVSQIVQQRCLNLRPSGFQTHRDFQSYLHDMYTYLVDEIHETLSRTALQEVDPLDPTPQPPTGTCSSESGPRFKEMEQRVILRELLFYSEESLAQGDFDNCHRLHLQRISRSREASQCWVDFAVMWLSRGDDRMAEIAVKEALRSDPKNINALTMAGLVAVRHNDERGIDNISAALALKPLSPELLVILAVSLAMVNNEMGSDYFFRKAAYIHRTLTGQGIGDLDKTFDNISKSIGIKQSVMEIAKAETETQAQGALEEPETSSVQKNEDASIPLESDPNRLSSARHSHTHNNNHHKNSSARRRSSDPKGRKLSTDHHDPKSVDPYGKKGSDHHEAKGLDHHGRKDSHPRKHSDPHAKRLSQSGQLTSKRHSHSHRHSLQKERNGSGEIHVNGEGFDHNEEEDDEEEDAYIMRNSVSGKTARKSSLSQQRFNFETDLSNITAEDAILSGLPPSLLIPWNVTEFIENKTKKSVEAADNLNVPDPTTKAEGETDIASDEILNAEYNKIADDEEEEEDPGQIEMDEAGTPGIPPVVQESKRKSIELSRKNGSQKKVGLTGPQETEEGKPDLRVYTNRLGSELIWTAQFLLQMRMFDILDGVLARELYVNGSRSIPFLYLRAMSLYFRQSQHEAIPILEEAIQLDSENPVFWMLKGHCHYEIGQNTEATSCYEATLRLPVGKENRHLLYLRYGSLSMDGANSETAKKVFLHGIQKYPTPYMWLATGNTCYAMGDFDEAEASFTEANRLDNTNPITWAHLALINLAKDQQALAEQSYKWALRFGLRKGKIMDEIKRLQDEKGFGDPSFPRVPNCIPHDYYVKRLGRQRPFDIYRDALINEPPTTGKPRFDDNAQETEMKLKLKVAAECGKPPEQKSEMAADPDAAEKPEEGDQVDAVGEPTETDAQLEEPSASLTLEIDQKQVPGSKGVVTKGGKASAISSNAKQGRKENGALKSIDRTESKAKTRPNKKSTIVPLSKTENSGKPKASTVLPATAGPGKKKWQKATEVISSNK